MRQTLSTTIAFAALASAAALCPAVAGTVEVKFTHETTPFTDIGRSSHSQRDALAALKLHFEALGKKLPATQALSVEVTDVDLAGEEQWMRGSDLRVLRGRADWPRIELSYTLREGSRTLRQGKESIADMAYLFTAHSASTDQPFGYERRMIDRWFSEKITAEKVAAR